MPDDMDFIFSDSGAPQATGGVASLLLNNDMNINSLRTNAVLRKDEWELLDRAVVQIARERLPAVQDLFDRNLTFDVPNPMGITVVQHQEQSEFIAAEVTMDGVTRSNYDNLRFDLVSTPLPIFHRDFQLTARHLAASRNGGIPLDTSGIEEATRQVAERIEDVLFNGVSAGDVLGFGSSSAQIFGYTNRTNRNTVALAVDWDASAITGLLILADVLAMITAAEADRMYGPFMLYVPTAFWVPLMDDFKTNSDKTILQRIKELPSIIDVKVGDKLTAANILLVQMTRNNVDMAMGMQPTVVQWETQGGMVLNFKVMAIMVPRIKLDYGNRSGVVHMS